MTPSLFRSVLLLLSSLIILSSCGGGSGGASGDSVEQALPDHDETINPSIIHLGNECIITIIGPVQHPEYEATLIFKDDIASDSLLSYSTSSLRYLVDMQDSKKVTLNVSDMTPSGANMPTRKYTLRASMTFTSTTEGTATWEIKEGSPNPVFQQTRTGSGAFTVTKR